MSHPPSRWRALSLMAIPTGADLAASPNSNCILSEFSMKRVLNLLLALSIACWVPAHAETISYTDSGTFSSSTATSAFSGPSETWAFSFQADINPAVLEFGNGGFDFAFSDFSYFLDGSPVAITPSFIRFFTASNGGGFLICFNGTSVATCTDALSPVTFGWPQMYTGPTSGPTLLRGAFTTDFAVVVDSTGYAEPDTTILATAVPEPSTLLLLAPPVLALARRRLYSRC